MKYPITILIPCSDDLMIKKCVESINQDVEILVSLNKPSKSVKNILGEFPYVKTITSRRKGIANAYNKGIEAATNDWILLMDSDCLFGDETIVRMWNLTKKFNIVKGKVVFKSKGRISTIIAKLREFTTSDKINAYSPPLLFNRNIKQEIGYYFHPALVWSEDADFNNRVIKNGIPIGYDPLAVIFHKSLSPKQDLTNAFRYGVGRQIGKEVGVYERHTLKSFISNIIKVIGNTLEISSKKGLFVSMYYFFFWNFFFRMGTLFQKYFRIYEQKD